MFIVTSSRKTYAPEYRQETARLVIESGRPIAHGAKDSAWAKDFWVNESNSNENAKAQSMDVVTPIFEPKTLDCAVN